MYTTIKLDKSRNLKYGMKALHLVEKTIGTKISGVDFDNLSMNDLAVFVWAGLFHEDTTLTPESVMDLIDEYSNIEVVLDAMTKALNESFGNSETGKKRAAKR